MCRASYWGDSVADTAIKIELTDEEYRALFELLDLGVKNEKSGGLAVAMKAAVLLQKFAAAEQAMKAPQAASPAPKSNGKAMDAEMQAE